MMSLTDQQLMHALGTFWWPWLRVTGFMLMAPLYGDHSIPMRVRGLVALWITAVVAPLHPDMPEFDPFSWHTAWLTVNELSIGLALGLVFYLLIAVFAQAGQIVSMQMGLAMAVMNDPKNGVSTSIMARLMMTGALLVFLSLNGHTLMVGILSESFSRWPIHRGLDGDDLAALLQTFGWFFAQSLLLAMPSVAIMLSSNLTFGLLSKLAPSINIFSLGFPFTILMGLAAFFLSLTNLGPALLTLSEEVNQLFDGLWEDRR